MILCPDEDVDSEGDEDDAGNFIDIVEGMFAQAFCGEGDDGYEEEPPEG